MANNNFDPDAYLAKKTTAQTQFDPDAYLKKKTPVAMSEALALGGFQGLSLGFADELSGRLEQLGSVFGRRGWGTEPIFQGRPETPEEQKESLAEVYAKGRDIRREREAAAKEEYPIAYPVAEFAGGMAAPIGAGTAAKSFLGAAAKGAASGAVAGGLQAAGTTEAETGGEIAKESLGGAGLGLMFGAGAGLVGRGLTGVTKAGRESLGAELEAYRRGYKAPIAEESIFASAGPLGRAAGKTLKGAKETISQAEEIGRIKNFLADNKKAYVSQMIDEGMPEERIRAARSMLDQMSDDEYIQMMVRSDTPAGRQVQELIARQSAAAFGGREKPEDYARLLGMGIESRSAARNFKAGKEAAGIIEPAQEALSRVTKKTGEKFRELSEQAAEEFQGITPQVVNLLEDVQAKLTDIQDNPRFFSSELKKAVENATDVLTDGKGPSFFKLQPGMYADVDNYEKFNRLQRFKEIIRDTIRPDVLSGKVGVKANTDERLALDLISQADDILKSSDAKVKANSIYAKMRDIEDFVFKGITRKGQVQRGKVEQQLSNRQSAQQWREDLNELRRWADDEVFAPEDRDAVKKFLQVYDEAFQKAEDANLVKGFNWAAGPSSPAIQRFLSAVRNNTEIQDLLQNPAKAVAEIDNFANSYVKQLTGKDKFSDLTDVEQRAFVRAQTWFKKEAEKGLVSPQSLVDNYKMFLTKLQKESAKGGGSGKFFSGQNVKEDIKDALTNYIGTKIGTAGLNELAKAAGSEQGINVFEPLKEDFKQYLMDEYKLTDTQAGMVVKVLPDNPLELMGMLPKKTINRVIKKYNPKTRQYEKVETKGKTVEEKFPWLKQESIHESPERFEKVPEYLFHSGIAPAKKIEKEGLVPQVGKIVKAAYSDEELGEMAPLVFFTDDPALGSSYAIQDRNFDLKDLEKLKKRGFMSVTKGEDLGGLAVYDDYSGELVPVSGKYLQEEYPSLATRQVESPDFVTDETVTPEYIVSGKDLFDYAIASKPRAYKEMIEKYLQEQKPVTKKKINRDYKISHMAPTKEGGAPLHNLKNIYPDDFYSKDGARFYGDGRNEDKEIWNIISSLKDRPDATVTVYRAVPNQISQTEQIAKIEKALNGYLKRNKMPDEFKNETYDSLSSKLEKLKSEPKTEESKIKINPGDWVTLSKQYAIEHGMSALNNNYKILSKKVKASDLFTDGNSLYEQGYDPKK